MDQGEKTGGRKTKGRKQPPRQQQHPTLRVVAGTEAGADRLEDQQPQHKPHALRGQGLNQHGLTAKQEAFAVGVANGLTLAAAYRQAYDAQNMAAATIYAHASRLMDNDKVAARVNALVAAKERDALHDTARTRRAVFEKLLTTMTDRNVPPAVQVRAAELLGKTVAMFTDRVEQADVTADAGADAVEQALQERLSRLLQAG